MVMPFIGPRCTNQQKETGDQTRKEPHKSSKTKSRYPVVKYKPRVFSGVLLLSMIYRQPLFDAHSTGPYLYCPSSSSASPKSAESTHWTAPATTHMTST